MLAGAHRGSSTTGYLTAEQAEIELRHPVFLVMSRRAYVRFPSSSTSRPSPVVQIVETTKDRGTSTVYSINNEQYRDSVLPVLEDESLLVSIPVNRLLVDLGSPSVLSYIDRIGKKLRMSFQAAGY